MPLGLPVVPDVYITYSGCSESKNSHACSVDAFSTESCHHTSRLSSQSTSWPVRRTTSTLSTFWPSSAALPTASSTAGFSADAAPRRYPPSAVMMTLASQSATRLASASAENPPKTTVCGAPIRAQASIATTVSGIIGR